MYWIDNDLLTYEKFGSMFHFTLLDWFEKITGSTSSSLKVDDNPSAGTSNTSRSGATSPRSSSSSSSSSASSASGTGTSSSCATAGIHSSHIQCSKWHAGGIRRRVCATAIDKSNKLCRRSWVSYWVNTQNWLEKSRHFEQLPNVKKVDKSRKHNWQAHKDKTIYQYFGHWGAKEFSIRWYEHAHYTITPNSAQHFLFHLNWWNLFI